jgi:hypothetical protein
MHTIGRIASIPVAGLRILAVAYLADLRSRRSPCKGGAMRYQVSPAAKRRDALTTTSPPSRSTARASSVLAWRRDQRLAFKAVRGGDRAARLVQTG